MRIGIFIGVVGSAPSLKGQVQQVVEAETDGFDSYWTPQVAGTDALTLLALAGARTNRIEVGTAVIPATPHSPCAASPHDAGSYSRTPRPRNRAFPQASRREPNGPLLRQACASHVGIRYGAA